MTEKVVYLTTLGCREQQILRCAYGPMNSTTRQECSAVILFTVLLDGADSGEEFVRCLKADVYKGLLPKRPVCYEIRYPKPAIRQVQQSRFGNSILVIGCLKADIREVALTTNSNIQKNQLNAAPNIEQGITNIQKKHHRCMLPKIKRNIKLKIRCWH